MKLPVALARLDQTPEGRRWLESLPALVATCAEQWSLDLGTPFAGSHVSLAVPVRGADGGDAVLKISYPHRESEHEAAALAAWDGDGAVRLLGHDPVRHALLIERCRPGDPLSKIDADRALDVLAGLLPRLQISADAPFHRLDDEAARWAASLVPEWERSGRPFAPGMLDATIEFLESPHDTPRVLLHQDLHADNVVAAQREPWLVIDPKPLVGDPAFGVAPIVRSSELGHDRGLVLRRLDRLTEQLGLDRERARRWTIAQTLAWASEGETMLDTHIEVATWLHEAG